MTLEFADPALVGGHGSRLADRYFSAHYLAIMRYCLRQLGDRPDAEDATQETFRRAFQQGIGQEEDPLPWLLTVARNVCVDEIRRRRSGRTALERSAWFAFAERPGHDDPSRDPEPVVVGRMFVSELLGQLTPAERRVVTGRLDGHSGTEMAATFGITASTTRVLLARAKEKLRRYLDDGRASLSALGATGSRLVHGARQRVLGHGWALQLRPELLLPALVITAVVGGNAAASAPAGGEAPEAVVLRTAAHHPLDLSPGATTASGLPEPGAESSAGSATSPSAPDPRTAPPATQPGTGPLNLLPAPDPHEVYATDFQPSPDYAHDHTVLMVGRGNCPQSCVQLFRSSDGGATWTYVPTASLNGTQLLLPGSSPSLSRFYAVGGGMLQVTRDGGASFHDVMPLAGYASAAPAWLGTDLVEADVAMSFLGSAGVPRAVAAFLPSEMAMGAPAVLPASGGGFVALQVVQNEVLGGVDTLLACDAGGCATRAQLPLSGPAKLIASPGYDSDHTLVAIGGGVAVSHDGGASFQLLSTGSASDATLVPGPNGPRLVAVEAQPGKPGSTLAYSDDLGATWHRAQVDQALQAGWWLEAPRVLRPGRLIAWAADDPAKPGRNTFVCSADGTRWSACTPDHS
jgi:RNA polymerase sigma-70 factor, ECF subfamily